jgi:hypothetical protein
MLLVLNSHVLRTAPTALPATFAQLQSRAREEEEGGGRGADEGHDDDDENRGWIHARNLPADRRDKRITSTPAQPKARRALDRHRVWLPPIPGTP